MRRDPLVDTSGGDGNTPLDPDELDGLIPPHLRTRADLNQWEARNLERAITWLVDRSFDVLAPGALESLHRRMFDQTWAWAGVFRRSDKNISPFRWTEVPRLMRDLVANTRVQRDALDPDDDAVDQLAARFHHELVRIHPWPNGNGRHGRLATDLLLRQWGRPMFTWGERTLRDDASPVAPEASTVRNTYIAALRRADDGDFTPLYIFVRR
ncbi:MAG: mobile mystery protein B [Gemmatimonadaceae bacterium]|nr:mobile mystery protein B [Gemmatimonadaceae bacterium]